ncbi:MAG: NADPH-dependent 7-cyano-7-deazaguanine reductase QueF [Candidatus Omnitrophica bacterium]|nr:NADPH-dependent 7-cyano-7-deazaguanine reductase QueF [Candidatus Omnitrophota bacterium]
MKKTRYEGLQQNVRKLKLPKIEVWENKYSDREYTIKIDTNEFTCVCPKTGLPDFAHICIEYAPSKYCIELKSFKEYLVAFRQIGIFHEHAANRIADDLAGSCKPRWVKVRGEFNLRGGVATTVEVYRKNEN